MMIVLIFAYETSIAPRYLSIGFNDEWRPDRLFEAAASFSLIAFFTALLPNRGYKLLLYFQLIIPVAALHIIYVYGVGNDGVLLLTAFAMAILIVLFPLSYVRYSLKIAKGHISLIVIGLLVIALYAALLIQQKGVGNFVTSFSDIYEFRENQTAVGASYLVGVMRGIAFTFAAVLFALALVHKRWLLMLVVVATYLLFFMYSGHRRIVFLPILMLMTYVLINRRFHLSMMWIFAVVVAFSVGLWILFQIDTFQNLLLRRTIFMPALLVNLYEEHFSQAGFMYFSHSKVGVLLGTFDADVGNPAVEVGKKFFRSNDANANSNWIGSGYMNIGMYGILLYGVIVAMLFSLSDWLLEDNNKKIFLISSVAIFSSFMQNSDLVSSILTNGVGIFLPILLIWGNADRYQFKESPAASDA